MQFDIVRCILVLDTPWSSGSESLGLGSQKEVGKIWICRVETIRLQRLDSKTSVGNKDTIHCWTLGFMCYALSKNLSNFLSYPETFQETEMKDVE